MPSSAQHFDPDTGASKYLPPLAVIAWKNKLTQCYSDYDISMIIIQRDHNINVCNALQSEEEEGVGEPKFSAETE